MTTLQELDSITAYGKWAKNYPPYAHNPVMCAEEKAMLSMIPKSMAGLNVLDAACGSGRYIKHAKERGAAKIVGTDISNEMLETAERAGIGTIKYSFGDNFDKPILLKSTLESIPVPDEWADIITCALAIGHSEELEIALGELARILKPGGKLLVSDFHPIIASLGFKRTFIDGKNQYSVKHNIHHISHWAKILVPQNLIITNIEEPFLDENDFSSAENEAIEHNSNFYRTALSIPSIIVLELSKTTSRHDSKALLA